MDSLPADSSLRPIPDWCEPAKHLFISIPMKHANVSEFTMASMFSSRGIDCRIDIRTVSRDPYIHRARNSLVTEFLQSDATDLMFLDDDVGFEAEAIGKIARAEKPFVGGVYPMKTEDGGEKYPIDLFPGVQTAVGGLLEVPMIPTGFLKLNRVVFEYMPYEFYRNVKGQIQFGYFDTFIGGGEFVGEDVRFCRTWRNLGGKIYLMPDLSFQHIGPHTWEGNFHKHLLEICR